MKTTRRLKIRSFSPLFTAWLIVIIFFILWELAVNIGNFPVYLLPAPGRIFSTLFTNFEVYTSALLITTGEAVLGLAFGLSAGLLLASLLILLPGLENGVMTLAILAKSTPLAAIAPLLTIWLGFGMLPKVIITAFMTFFPVLVNLLSGMQRVDPAMLDQFRSWRANRFEIFIHLRLPGSLPFLFSALKISAPLALIGAVVAEWTGASGGLGRIMWLAYTNLNLPYLFAAIFVVSAVGMLIYGLLNWIEKRVVFWNLSSEE